MFVKNGSVVTTVRELIGRSSKMRRDDNDYYTRRYLIPNIWTFSTLQKPASSQKGGSVGSRLMQHVLYVNLQTWPLECLEN